MLLPIYIIFFAVLIWWVAFRPQQRRKKEMEALQSRVNVGDDIVTTSGIHGRISALEEDTLLLEIAEDTDIRIAKAAVGEIVSPVSDE
ncbi:MAG: preprotein translocase subunit YajC [Thermoleophilia bacterium]|nr:preprotein translocase subunit YajC [Thermoleophilia bacterium]